MSVANGRRVLPAARAFRVVAFTISSALLLAFAMGMWRMAEGNRRANPFWLLSLVFAARLAQYLDEFWQGVLALTLWRRHREAAVMGVA